MAATAAVMNNMELSRAVEMINAQITDLSNKLASAIPEIDQKISDSESDIKMMFNAMKQEVQPLLGNLEPMQLQIKSLDQKLEALGGNTFQRMDSLTKDIENRMSSFEATMSATRDTLHQTASKIGVDARAKARLDAKVDSISSSIENMSLDFEHQKRVEENHYQQTQMQLATAMTVSPTPGSHGPPKKQDPLATHRRLVPEAKISGSESVAVLKKV